MYRQVWFFVLSATDGGARTLASETGQPGQCSLLGRRQGYAHATQAPTDWTDAVGSP